MTTHITQARAKEKAAHNTTPTATSEAGHCHRALGALGSNQQSPENVTLFQSFTRGPGSSLTPPPAMPDGDIYNDNNDFYANPGGDPDDDPGNDPGGDPNDPAGDNPDDEENPFQDDPPEEEAMETILALAHAIDTLTRDVRRVRWDDETSGWTKLCKLDQFDSTDPKKLRAFLIQCELNFQDQPCTFCTDRAKVTFAQSYLKGMALEWFEPDLLNNHAERKLWMDSWQEFILELQLTFGPHDPISDAENQLNKVHMKDNQWINKYLVEFNRIASQLRGYGEAALRHHFYNGLLDWIKDKICCIGKPQSQIDMHHLAHKVDACYWERKEEVQCASKQQATSSPSHKSSSGSSNNNATLSKTGQDKPKSGSPSSNNNSLLSKASLLTTPVNSKLGKDGKLMPEERKRCQDNNLCMFCEGAGHFADKCSKKTKAAKAHVAAAESSESGSKPASTSGATLNQKNS